MAKVIKFDSEARAAMIEVLIYLQIPLKLRLDQKEEMLF